MILYEWAIRHNIPVTAIKELEQMLGIADRPGVPMTGLSEAAVQNNVRLEAGRKGVRLFRNNVGAMYDEQGNFVRFGLANESAQMNKTIKSADLIGIRSILVTPQMVGHRVGVFVSRETKRGDWRYAGDPDEVAQLNWLMLILSLGGDAAFANAEGTL